MSYALDAKYYKIQLKLREGAELAVSFQMSTWEYYRDFLIIKHGNKRYLYPLSNVEAFQLDLDNIQPNRPQNTTGGTPQLN